MGATSPWRAPSSPETDFSLLRSYFAAAGNLAAHFSWSLVVHCCGSGVFGRRELFPWHLSLLGVKNAVKGCVIYFAVYISLLEHVITFKLAVWWVFGVHAEQNACIHSLPEISHKYDNLSKNSSRNMVVFKVSFCGGFAAAGLIFRLFSNFSKKASLHIIIIHK